jgi:predicted outer membrane protein
MPVIEPLALILLLAAADVTTLPQGIIPADERPAGQENPTDPLFDRELIATDDAAFVRDAIEGGRQAIVEARIAERRLHTADLRAAAGQIARQNETTCAQLEKLATSRGWPIPEDHDQRKDAVEDSAKARTAANFIVSQIAFHEVTLAKFRAQLGGDGDASLKNTLRNAVPRYQENLELLLRLDI